MVIDGADNERAPSSSWTLVDPRTLGETERKVQKRDRSEVIVIIAEEDRSYLVW